MEPKKILIVKNKIAKLSLVIFIENGRPQGYFRLERSNQEDRFFSVINHALIAFNRTEGLTGS